jgi:[ribosomal protein S5]-alanine N-acetyltransferase
MEIFIEKLKLEDASELFKFECQNRKFFEKQVPSRGNDYYRYEHFQMILKELLNEQSQGTCNFHLIRNDENTIVGRINLIDIDPKKQLGHIGYRVGENYTGLGVATKALELLLLETEHYSVNEIHAKTTPNNLGSQIVLERNSFQRCFIEENAIELNGEKLDFIHYVWKKGSFHVVP